MNTKVVVISILAAILATGATASERREAYHGMALEAPESVRMGTIQRLRWVEIDGANGTAEAAPGSSSNTTRGIELTVKEKDGAIRSYVQPIRDNFAFRVGDPVQILTANGQTRVATLKQMIRVWFN